MRFATITLALSFVGLPATTLRADTIVLRDAGRVDGRILNPDQQPRKTYIIETFYGGTITLAADLVAEVIPQRPVEEEYQALRVQSADTAEGHWQLAEWCRENHLADARTEHLERVIQLDPDHADARKALGYYRFNGRWATQDDVMMQRGYVRYKGRWRLPQELELMERRRQEEQAEKAWIGKLKRWRDALQSDRAEQAAQSIATIDDPTAVPALEQALRDDPIEEFRLLYLAGLASINQPPALSLLVQVSLHDPSEEVRLTAIEHLIPVRQPDLIAAYVKTLRSADNLAINRAAIALRMLKAETALEPLVDALVSTHTYKLTQGTPGGVNPSFSSGPGGGGSGLSVGQSVQVVKQQLANPAVLDALIELTGVNYDYDVTAWKHWLASRHPNKTLDARRD